DERSQAVKEARGVGAGRLGIRTVARLVDLAEHRRLAPTERIEDAIARDLEKPGLEPPRPVEDWQRIRGFDEHLRDDRVDGARIPKVSRDQGPQALPKRVPTRVSHS